MIESFFFAESFPLVLSLDSSTFSPIKIYTENQPDVILFLLYGLNIGHLAYIILISYYVFLEDFFGYRKLQIYCQYKEHSYDVKICMCWLSQLTQLHLVSLFLKFCSFAGSWVRGCWVDRWGLFRLWIGLTAVYKYVKNTREYKAAGMDLMPENFRKTIGPKCHWVDNLWNESIVDQGLESWIGFLNLEGSAFYYGWMPHMT